ncbi:unnamed protein product, partial [marine sediment metagenome]
SEGENFSSDGGKVYQALYNCLQSEVWDMH